MNIILYGNGSSGNHGCEAIVRGTAELFGKNNSYVIQSDNPTEDIKYGLSDFATVYSAKSERNRDWRFIYAYIKLKLTGNYSDMDGLYYLPGIKSVKGKADVALSVGGDNYCYGGTGIYAYLNRAYRKQGIKTVLWGCSVESDVVAEFDVAKDLASYDCIVARESITYEAIRKVQDNVFLIPDPAFYMKSQACTVDERLNSGNVIGINVSPVIISNESKEGIAYENYKYLIKYILKETDATVALIPHVVWDRSDDRKVLKQLYDDFSQNERIVLVGDHTAPELKYIISRCRFFIGARTHATIAAYSTCVPTIVVGYSVKAKGIAKDLFGTDEGYVLPVQEFESHFDLTNAFIKIYDKEKTVKEHLSSFMPKYCERANNIAQTPEVLIRQK